MVFKFPIYVIGDSSSLRLESVYEDLGMPFGKGLSPDMLSHVLVRDVHWPHNSDSG